MPSARQRARSPVRYSRPPSPPNGSAGQVGTVQVAPRQARAADVQLADAPGGHRVQVAVEQVPRQVANRLADRAADVALQIGFAQRTVGHVDRGLGDAVHVDQSRRAVAEALEPWPQVLDVQRLAAEHHITQRQGLRIRG